MIVVEDKLLSLRNGAKVKVGGWVAVGRRRGLSGVCICTHQQFRGAVKGKVFAPGMGDEGRAGVGG